MFFPAKARERKKKKKSSTLWIKSVRLENLKFVAFHVGILSRRFPLPRVPTIWPLLIQINIVIYADNNVDLCSLFENIKSQKEKRKLAAVLSPIRLVPSPASLSFSNSHYALYIPELMLTMPFLQNCKEVFLIFSFLILLHLPSWQIIFECVSTYHSTN